MITLTTPPSINTVLGGNALVAFGKMVIGPFTFEPGNGMSVKATVKLTSTTVTTMEPIIGNLTVDIATSVLTITVNPFIQRKITLSGSQVTAVQTIIQNAQNALETGIINLGVVAGTQSTGA